jgi:hypothetical protein
MDVVTLQPQHSGKRLRHALIVVDNENGCRVAIGFPPDIACWHRLIVTDHAI